MDGWSPVRACAPQAAHTWVSGTDGSMPVRRAAPAPATDTGKEYIFRPSLVVGIGPGEAEELHHYQKKHFSEPQSQQYRPREARHFPPEQRTLPTRVCAMRGQPSVFWACARLLVAACLRSVCEQCVFVFVLMIGFECVDAAGFSGQSRNHASSSCTRATSGVCLTKPAACWRVANQRRVWTLIARWG